MYENLIVILDKDKKLLLKSFWLEIGTAIDQWEWNRKELKKHFYANLKTNRMNLKTLHQRKIKLLKGNL